MHSRRLLGDHVNIGGGSFKADTALEDPGSPKVHGVIDVPVESIPPRVRPGPGDRHVDVGADCLEARRHYADDRPTFPVEHDGFANDVAVALKLPFPKAEVQQNDRRRSS
jgi:hypothetical protein